MLLARQQGLLQVRELEVYDRFVRWQPPARGWESRVVLVRISEEDFERHGYPLPDRILAQAVHELAKLGPRAIGVDLYRDQPVGAGRVQLEEIARRHPNSVWVE